jgi:hypothetical protein
MSVTSLALVLAFGLTLSSSAFAAGAGTSPSPHVRTNDPAVAAALSRGSARSATFRLLLDRLDRSTVIVHVQRASFRRMSDGKTQFVSAADEYRSLRTTIQIDVAGDWLIGLLGHELQHAVEVADAPDVRSEKTYGRLYARIGVPSVTCHRSGACFDTPAARAAGYRVIEELRREPTPSAVTATH